MGASTSPYGQQGSSANLADILERVLDKGVVIAGDIQINLLDIELLTIKLRLLVASVDKAKEMGIDWWEHDPSLSSRAHVGQKAGNTVHDASPVAHQVEAENARLRAEIAELRAAMGPPGASSAEAGRGAPPRKPEAENAQAKDTEGEEWK
ncbi:gas vesicle protein [Streptomyces sp. NPDC025273]